ncbi:MAG: carboxylating nicotinate-nucleotide diphosphorylase [Nitrososphaerota archaeon]|nr:carboxylating nicotinate-nucleotide diphosphorylase [Candidatus Bathyarchaeota archaeon]MDW8062185.1 carboxylating nicotinate-nucleotide diphosphorylase [Nitrososphaerota archaeon]
MWLPKPVVVDMLLRFLEEDLGLTDVTTALIIDEGVKAEGVIVAKEDGVAAGLEEACILAEIVGLEVEYSIRDGEGFRRGDTLLKLKGDARTMLAVERTMLNILSRMCGVATATRRLVDKIRKAGLNVRVAATRKIPPGLRYFDKKAIEIGGGDTHRLRLEDTILIKDNHIALVGSVKKAVARAKARASFTYKIEVEVSSVGEALEAAEAGADIIMLDNFTVGMVEEAMKLLEEKGLREKVLIEISGGIDEGNILEYASKGIDIVSLGRLTHSVKAIDLSLDVRLV